MSGLQGLNRACMTLSLISTPRSDKSKHTVLMLKHFIIAAAVLARQILATVQSPPTTLQHDTRSNHRLLDEHTNKLVKRHGNDVAEQILKLAPKCEK